ncbi:MAG: hypothetical protein GX557_04090, partial [Chloroflexi bacterium]|nr:hypothetical protein [Chloroflexota bacterium]
TLASYRQLKTLYTFLDDWGVQLAPLGTLLPPDQAQIRPEDRNTLRWCVRAGGDQGFLFLNNYQDRVDTEAHEDVMRPNLGVVAPSAALDDEERRHLEALDDQMDMAEHRGVQFRLLTDSGEVRLPATGGLSLRRGISAILPFNLRVGALRLRWATVQPFARLETDTGEHLFFFAPDGMAPEYGLDATTVAAVAGAESSRTVGDDLLVVTPALGFCAPLVVTVTDGRQVRITTLTREQADDCWKVELWGRARLVHTRAGLLGDADTLEVYRIGDNDLSFGVYPAPEGELAGPQGALRGEPDGLLTRYRLRVPAVEPALRVTLLRKDKALLSFGPGLLQGMSDLFLRIGYIGDSLEAFVDGRLVSDNLCNGTPWEIGLKRFTPEIVDKGMYLYVAPLVKGSAADKAVGKQLARAYGRALDDEENAEILSIEALPEYRVRVARG